MEILVPALLDGVESMVPSYNVDVYLILGYELSMERRKLVQDLLPAGVGLEVWNSAEPLSYEFSDKHRQNEYLSEASRILARQHRYVIKDKLPNYDFFMAFEDDMLVKKTHIDYYLQFRQEMQRLKILASTAVEPKIESSMEGMNLYDGSRQHWGNITWEQLDRIFPGFLSVEVMTNPKRHTQTNLGPIRTNRRVRPDPQICCHGRYIGLNGKLAPRYPHSNQLLIWGTAIACLLLRKMPEHSQLLDWVALLNIDDGPPLLGGYWTGTDGALLPDYTHKPLSNGKDYTGQSAGWMATAREIMDLESRTCKGSSFLPPYHEPQIHNDGIAWDTDSVEFWSSGFQMWGPMRQIQRLVSLDPRQFSATILQTSHLPYCQQQTKRNRSRTIGQSYAFAWTTPHSQASFQVGYETTIIQCYIVRAALFVITSKYNKVRLFIIFSSLCMLCLSLACTILYWYTL